MNITPHPFKPGDLVRAIAKHKSLAIVLKTLPRRRVRVVWMDNMEIDEGGVSRFDMIQASTGLGQDPGRAVDPKVYQRLGDMSKHNMGPNDDDTYSVSCN